MELISIRIKERNRRMTKIYNPISETENWKIPKKRPMDETKSG